MRLAISFLRPFIHKPCLQVKSIHTKLVPKSGDSAMPQFLGSRLRLYGFVSPHRTILPDMPEYNDLFDTTLYRYQVPPCAPRMLYLKNLTLWTSSPGMGLNGMLECSRITQRCFCRYTADLSASCTSLDLSNTKRGSARGTPSRLLSLCRLACSALRNHRAQA